MQRLSSGAILFDLWQLSDPRGKNFEGFSEREFSQYLPEGVKFVRDCYSKSRMGVLRGLHGDRHTWKLIQCLYGSISFVVLNLETKEVDQMVLTESIPQAILVPANCVNGHLCLTPECVFSYKMTTYHEDYPQLTVRWNDKVLSEKKIDWNGYTAKWKPTLSTRDEVGPFEELL